MLRNYIKVAFRSLIKQRVYSIINITGLAVGIASSLLITLYVKKEFSYDTDFNNSENIYKVALERKYPNHATFYAIVPHSYSDAIRQNIPEVKRVTRLSSPNNNVLVTYKDGKGDEKVFEENFVAAADSNFFEVFDITFVKGEAGKAFAKPNDIVICESAAKRIFGDEEPLGKSIQVGGNPNNILTVNGVYKDLPDNTHFRFDFVTNISGQPFFSRENYTGFSTHLYVELNPGADFKVVESKIPKLVDTYAAAQIERDLGKSWEDYKKEGNGYRYFLQPLTSVHLDPTNIEGKMEPGGNLSFMYFLVSIAILLVVIACINFMNLATARSAERAREVGVRKTMGSIRGQLIAQFLSESILLSFIAMALALLISQLLLPAFNNLTEKQLTLNLSLPVISGLLLLAVVIGLLAGSYPAFILSAFNPVTVMKGKFTSNKQGSWLRNGLVIFQFSISIVLIVGTLVVQRQMEYVYSKSLGFDKEQLLVIERTAAIDREKTKTFMEELRQLPEVVAVSGLFGLPGRQREFAGAFFQPEGSSEILTTKSMFVSDGLLETMGMQIIEGKGFSENTNDSLSIVLNESAVKAMELKNPVGLKLGNVQRRPEGNVTVFFTIIGIVKDFHFQSLRDEITPLVLQSSEFFGGGANNVLARIKPGQYTSAIQAVEAKWKVIAPDRPFHYFFFDENFNTNYKNERQAGKLFTVFAGLAILIACVGLFGLSAYTAHLRTKEIGIRKVMGASVGTVVILLARDFTRMIIIAFFIAIPLSWYLMQEWLLRFAYRIPLTPWVFIMAGAVTVLIAWVTVSFQTIRAAVVNPVNSLKSE